MQLEISENYEELAIEWQYQMITLLRKTLQKYEVAEEKAKEIVGEFAFDFAMLHDQGEIKVNGEEYSPRIVFDNFNGALVA